MKRWDGYHQRWFTELFVEGVVSVYEIEDEFMFQKWFELRIGREVIHIPPTVLGPLQDAMQAMIERKL
jgi:hypothetical protein